jgi:hypothetical protein
MYGWRVWGRIPLLLLCEELMCLVLFCFFCWC